mmetsp:Transcript_164969/g.316753  ORF Transcript_164969/g.316753 Transcript_164969/m.316753 type:complete len:336 (-) Transcript_164969:102-1109(-)
MLMMHAAIAVFVCLTCACQSRRVQLFSESLHSSTNEIHHDLQEPSGQKLGCRLHAELKSLESTWQMGAPKTFRKIAMLLLALDPTAAVVTVGRLPTVQSAGVRQTRQGTPLSVPISQLGRIRGGSEANSSDSALENSTKGRSGSQVDEDALEADVLDAEALKDLMTDPELHAEAESLGEELKKMMDDPRFQEEAKKAAEQIKTMFADPNFQSAMLQGFGAGMGTAGPGTDGKASETKSTQPEAEPNMANMLLDVMNMLRDPECQAQLKTVMGNPLFQEQAKRVAEQMTGSSDLAKIKQTFRIFLALTLVVVFLALTGLFFWLKTLRDVLLHRLRS